MTSQRNATSAAAVRHPLSESFVADAALLAELALTFDLDAIVAEAQRDPFRR